MTKTPAPKSKLCAMGQPGCSLDNGELYPVRNPCTRPRETGHIFCDQCREEAGGYPKIRVVLPARSRTA